MCWRRSTHTTQQDIPLQRGVVEFAEQVVGPKGRIRPFCIVGKELTTRFFVAAGAAALPKVPLSHADSAILKTIHYSTVQSNQGLDYYSTLQDVEGTSAYEGETQKQKKNKKRKRLDSSTLVPLILSQKY
jgi:hypothetical protein